MKKDFAITDAKRKVDEDGIEYYIGTVTWTDGKVEKRYVHKCPNCGQWLRPGSISADEGYHIDGCW